MLNAVDLYWLPRMLQVKSDLTAWHCFLLWFWLFLNLIFFCLEVHARRLAALKALTAASESSSEILAKLYEIVFGILEKVGNAL